MIMATMILALVATAAPAALPELPLKSCVLDEAATLRQETLALLQSLCVDLDRGGSGQLVVAVVTNLHGRHDLSDLALELFRHIQIGHLDRDDGVILLVRRSRSGCGAIRITVGYGLEGGITEEKLHGLIAESWRSELCSVDFDATLVRVAQQLSSMFRE